ncbi:general stress protein [Bacillus badius]|uniref:General stress protein 17M n=1 Tax=Bacillus badius TaxID=1455 RepID=A0ABR5AWD2_BACBA|nr:general stress protein [Bacillus badius]KIL74572.1 General stress protein 17M [Bacillus badius]KIL79040.1 General stress protein 17M [Bacillus badius]KZN99796.1 general stress protein [Bacillus badius]KZR58784.1 general stress protein [Bacillus badius]MED4715526.1 general stress protein [Bacillus badius]
MVTTKTVENAVQAKQEIEGLLAQGFSLDDMYILAHDGHRGEDISEALHTNEVGMKEQGLLTSMSNIFKSRGDELRSKMEALGLSQQEAETYEKELDKGKLVLIANKE